MLKPEEIDVYFNADAGAAKDKTPQVSAHTRRVMLAKLFLPGLAAIFIVVLMVFPSLKKDTKEFTLDFTVSKGDIEKMNIEKTTIYATDKNNRVNNFIAESIQETSAGSQIYNLNHPEAIMPMNDDEWFNIKSPDGDYNRQTGLLHLKNHVEAFYSRDMNFQSEEAFFDFKQGIGYSHKTVTGSGFIGNVTAEGFEFSNARNTLTFLGKTRIILDEENLRKE